MRTPAFLTVAALAASCDPVAYDTWTVRRVPGDSPVAYDIVIDNDDPRGYTEHGAWLPSSGAGHFGETSRWTATGVGDEWAAFSPIIGEAGRYLVRAWWVTGSNRATNAEYRIEHAGGATSVRVDQTDNGSKWNLLGAFDFGVGSAGAAVLTDAAEDDRVVSADAVRFQLARLVEVIVDNADEGFVASANWETSAEIDGFWGDDYRRREAEGVHDPAAWRAELPVDGDYEIFARSVADAAHTGRAPYLIYHTGGEETVAISQRDHGGQWVSLGTFHLQAGLADRVHLSCWTVAGYDVVADAIRFVLRMP